MVWSKVSVMLDPLVVIVLGDKSRHAISGEVLSLPVSLNKIAPAMVESVVPPILVYVGCATMMTARSFGSYRVIVSVAVLRV